jgi:hypothetical protein
VPETEEAIFVGGDQYGDHGDSSVKFVMCVWLRTEYGLLGCSRWPARNIYVNSCLDFVINRYSVEEQS